MLWEVLIVTYENLELEAQVFFIVIYLLNLDETRDSDLVHFDFSPFGFNGQLNLIHIC